MRARGCRFVAPVQVVDEPIASPVSASTANPQEDASAQLQAQPQTRHRRGWVIAMAVVALLGAAGSMLLVQRGAGARQQLPSPSPSTVAASTRPIVAVLPFDSIAGTADDAVLVRGIAETLLHQLAQSPELVVIARESSFALGNGADIAETSRRLHATYLVTGSVQREGDSLRITTHLVDVASGTQLWSRRFDRSRRDLFPLQDEIAAEVAAALQLDVEQARQISGPHSGTRNLAAWLAFQRGRELLARRSRDDLVAATAQFESALHEDPRFASAMVALAEARILRSMSADSEFWASSRPEMSDTERADALRLISSALQVDSGNGEAYAARALLQSDPRLALQDARRGVELAPNNATAVRRLAQLVYRNPGADSGYDHASRIESLRLLGIAEKIDPLSAATQLLMARGHLYSFGEVDQALAIAERMTAEHPDFHAGWVQLGEILWCCRGEIARAIVALEHARALDPHAQWTRDFLSQAYLDIDDPVAARAVVAGAEFAGSASHSAFLMLEGRYPEAIDRGIRHLKDGTTGLNAAVLMQAMYAEIATSTPRPVSVQLAQDLVRASRSEPGARALAAAQQAGLRNPEGQVALLKAIADMKKAAYEEGRGDIFLLRDLIHAQVAAGDLDGAMASFLRARAPGVNAGSYWFEARDPLLDALRGRPEFIQVYKATRAHLEAERRAVLRLRDQGKLPRYPG